MYIGINIHSYLTNVQDVCTENYKVLLKEIKEDQKKEEYVTFMAWRLNIVINSSQIDPYMHWNTIKI